MKIEDIKHQWAIELYKYLIKNRPPVFISDKENIRQDLGWTQTRLKRSMETLSDLKLISYEFVRDDNGKHKCVNICVKRI